MITYDNKMAVLAEDFVDYIDELSEKAILMRSREDPRRGLIVKPCDSSRYFPIGKWKAKQNIRTRFGRYYNSVGAFLTLTYDHEQFLRWDAWGRLRPDLRRFKHDIVMRFKRAGWDSPKYICAIEEQELTGYPHVHLFYPGLNWLLDKDVIKNLWSVGRTRIEKAKSVNIGGYVCKYITKMGGWSDEALAFIWKNRIRLYSYSRCYSLPVETKESSEWAFLMSTTRQKIENNLNMIVQVIPDLENLSDYLEKSKS